MHAFNVCLVRNSENNVYCVLASRYDVMHNKQNHFAFISSSLLSFFFLNFLSLVLYYFFVGHVKPNIRQHFLTLIVNVIYLWVSIILYVLQTSGTGAHSRGTKFG